MLRIGITMRNGSAGTRLEPRDALARDWHRLMALALPEVAWLPVPNLGAGIKDWVQRWALDGVILSGGEDRGIDPLRDETEDQLWSLCQSGRLRMLGVCRGLQQLWQWHGGALAPVAGHVAVRHALRWVPPWSSGASTEREVNSFHAQGLAGATPPDLQPFAWGPAGEVEAVSGLAGRCAGLMWHPERTAEPDAEDVRYLRWFWLHEAPC